MTIELNWERAFNIPSRKKNTTVATRSKKLAWSRCPRCIGGNMYSESNGENVCIQCGHRGTSKPVNLATSSNLS